MVDLITVMYVVGVNAFCPGWDGGVPIYAMPMITEAAIETMVRSDMSIPPLDR
jgi:hypothetical protein